ncbi:hypothetical protein [Microcystis aeruginosa]|uniref:hypothetical protein n=1 Tax=Microcystis aeruginosa TaxID=1126 RepID=UPI003F755F3F
MYSSFCLSRTGVGFYRFSGRSARLRTFGELSRTACRTAVVNYLIFREKMPKSSPRSLPVLALFDFKKA